MSTPKFETYTTLELGPERLQALTDSFNDVFGKNVDPAEMNRRFITSSRGESYHSIMEDNGVVAGACTAVPYVYSYNGAKKTFAYLGGLFVKEAYRKDPLAMFKLYRNLRALLVEKGVDLIMAVPNDNAFPYFKVALKWKETANLPYYVLPVRLGNIRKASKALNFFSKVFAFCSGTFNLALTAIANKTTEPAPIRILRNEPLLEQHRFTPAHGRIKAKNHSFFYRTVDEEGIRSSYLIDFYNADGMRDRRSLAKAVNYIRSNEQPDIILFIGNPGFPQLSLLKVPKRSEPRTLHFCVEILDRENIKEDVFDYGKWDFGLYNFDAR